MSSIFIKARLITPSLLNYFKYYVLYNTLWTIYYYGPSLYRQATQQKDLA